MQHKDKVDKVDVNKIQENKVKGCIFEADLGYWEQLQNDYQLLLMKACYQIIAKRIEITVSFQLFFNTKTNLHGNT